MPIRWSWRNVRAELVPQRADAVLDDLEVLLPDVHDVPLDEIISFRAQHGAEFRA